MQLTVAEVHEAIAAALRTQECLVHGDRRLTWADVNDRTRRLANYLGECGLGCNSEREHLAGHESGQDHLAIYLHNGAEYLEAMIGAFKARVAPLNVNYRYVADELRYLLNDANASAIVVHSRFTPILSEVLADLPDLRVIIQVRDESGLPLLAGAVWYDDALAASSAQRPAVRWSPDDLYILYTGGTTGLPKGVMWRNGDALIECFSGAPVSTVDEAVAAATRRSRALITPPFMHGAGHWVAMRVWNSGGTVFIPRESGTFDPAATWAMVEREALDFLLIVGDAFARPLLDELDRRHYDLSSLTVLLSGGAPLNAAIKQRLLEHLPHALIVDGMGSSEAGAQLAHVSSGGSAATGRFPLTGDNRVLSADLDRVLAPGDEDLGWLAKGGLLALGYLGDPDKTRRTYPVIDGVRYAVPGDRAKLLADGTVELHGRDSATINTGGEKVFAEEVEAALKQHAAVYDCVVAGRPSERWGTEVVAVVQLRAGATANAAQLNAVAGEHLARYKLPKDVVFVDAIQRSPSGKPDYRWARHIAAGGTP